MTRHLADILRVNPPDYLGPLADILRPVADVDRWIRALCDQGGGSYSPWADYSVLCISVGARVIVGNAVP